MELLYISLSISSVIREIINHKLKISASSTCQWVKKGTVTQLKYLQQSEIKCRTYEQQ
jgi:hypothetical protein